MKEEIKATPSCATRSRRDGGRRAPALEGSDAGSAFVDGHRPPYRSEFGYKSIWSHEFAFPTWVERPAPIIEAVRGYLATDYDYRPRSTRVTRDLEARVRS
jgi:pyruvate,water dikinase